MENLSCAKTIIELDRGPIWEPNVRFGSLADITPLDRDGFST